MLTTRVALVYLALVLALAAASSAADQECLACHGQAGMKSDAGKSISIDPARHAASAHAVLGESACASCHGSVHELTTAEKLIPGKCTECHAEEAKDLASSIHGQAAKNGDSDAPKCVSCHGPIHAVKPSSEAD